MRVLGFVVMLLVPACRGGTEDASPEVGTSGGGGTSSPFDDAGAAGILEPSGGGVAGVPPCVDDSGCAAGLRCERVDGRCRPRCADDFECGERGTCDEAAGLCRELQGCGPNGSCGVGTTCDCHDLCVADEGNPCLSDLQCVVADFCDPCSGRCKPRGAPCDLCDPNVKGCQRGTDICLPIGAAGRNHCLRGCAGQGNCDALGPGYACTPLPDGAMACLPRSGECVASTECEGDGDCMRGRFCDEAGQCRPGCTLDSSCPNLQVCAGSRCSPPCQGDGDCSDGQTCDPAGRCGVVGGCTSSSDCPAPETHCDRDQQSCVAGCERDDDCLDATRACTDGRCVTRGCVSNFQCAFGEVCDQGSGLCQPAGGRHCESPCDPMDELACGGGGNECLSLQDPEGNAQGDYCFEPCQEAPTECPQGYQCVALELMSMPGAPAEAGPKLCVRRCDLEPIR